MTVVKKIILYLFGIILLVFGNKVAITKVFGEEEKENLPVKEEKPEKASSMFGTIDLEKKESNQQSVTNHETTLESDNPEAASASQ